MSCISPIQAVRSEVPNDNGKFPMLFDANSLKRVHFDDIQWMPCGRCVACRLKKSSDWAFRMICESKCHSSSSFITLTFSPENLKSMSLDLKLFQDFFKRLRERIFRIYGVKIRMFHCGEYGDLNLRPHYHCIVFGWDFPDRYFWKNTSSGSAIYRSPLLEDCWGFGYSSVGSVTFESCAYVARYVTKKVTGDLADEHYKRVDLSTGEVYSVLPEYATMSRMPGIGHTWFQSNYRDIYPKDFMTFGNGRKVQPPPYFDKLLKKVDPYLYDDVKEQRVLRSLNKEPFSFARADSIRQCFEAKLKNLVRTLDC